MKFQKFRVKISAIKERFRIKVSAIKETFWVKVSDITETFVKLFRRNRVFLCNCGGIILNGMRELIIGRELEKSKLDDLYNVFFQKIHNKF